jgi:hypothetical protein
MRHFPHVVVTLLLFLIAVLLGVMLYLQDTRGHHDDLADAGRDRPQHRPWDPIRPPDSPDAGEQEESADRPDNDRPGEDSGVAEAGARIAQEPRRIPPEDELKPDLKAFESERARAEAEKLAAQQRLEAVLARGAVLEQEQDGQSLNARVLWIVPPLHQLGLSTPKSVGAHYCGPLSGIKKAPLWQQMLEVLELEDLKGEELESVMQQTWLLTGQVTYNGQPKPSTQDWTGVTRPPVIVSGLGTSALVNEQGWFVLAFRMADWATHFPAGISVRFPGWVLASGYDTAESRTGPAVALARDPTQQAAVTLNLVAAPTVMLELRVDPAGVVRSATRVWLELFSQQRNLNGPRPEIGLFLEADFPDSGVIVFAFPDPDTFTTAKPVFGAAGDGWSSGTPAVLETWDVRPSTQPTKNTRFTLLRHTLSMNRASTFLVKGTCLRPGNTPERRAVRLEAKQTGVRTWTSDGAFALWVELDRGNWQENLIVDPVYAGAFQFNLDYDGQRPGNVVLEAGGSAPVGPWRVTMPEQDRFPRYVYCDAAIDTDSVRGLLHERSQYMKLEAVEGYPGFYYCQSFPARTRNFQAVTRAGRVRLVVVPAGDNPPVLPEGVRQTDPWGQPLPVIVLKHRQTD